MWGVLAVPLPGHRGHTMGLWKVGAGLAAALGKETGEEVPTGAASAQRTPEKPLHLVLALAANFQKPFISYCS